MSGRSRASSGKDFRRNKRSQEMWLAHNSSSSDEYSGVCVRSSFSDISVTDLISFLRDVQKFLDRLNHEDLSDDCREIKQSLSGRIDFYTKKSKSDWMLQSNSNLNRESLDLNASSRSSRLSLSETRGGDSVQPPPLPSRKLRNSFSMETSNSSTEESSYDTNNYSSNTDWEEEMKPAMTSTPRKLRTLNTDTSLHSTASLMEEEEIDEDEEYDLVEIRHQPSQGEELRTEQSLGLDCSARTVTAVADHRGYLYKKESIFKSTRYWAAIAQSRLYLFSDINSVNCKECHNLEDAYLKRHKKENKKFLVQLSGTYKNKNSKQEYYTENPELAETWINHLENAIATAGKTPKTMKKLSVIKLVSRSTYLSENVEVEEDPEDDEDYDVVEVKGHNVSLPSLPSQAPPQTIYDVPKSHGAGDVTRSRSSWSLDKGQDQEVKLGQARSGPGLEVRFKQPPPLPSPRKYLNEGRSLPATPSSSNPPSIYDTKVSNKAVRNLFQDVEEQQDEEEEEPKPKMSPEFSSKTLKPKKQSQDSSGVGTRFRPRNKSESIKQPEAVYNELSLILERRRQNLETKPTVPNRPKNLSVDSKETFPPYSKVNKVPRQQKDPSDSGEISPVKTSSDQLRPLQISSPSRQITPTKSFLHSFAQSGKLASSSEATKNTFNTFKGW